MAFVIGVGSPHLECPALSACKNLVVEHDIRMTDGIARLIGNVSGNGSAGPQTENQILRFEPWSNDDRGREILMLLIHLRDVTAMARGEDILARQHAHKSKNSFPIRDFEDRKSTRLNSSHLVISYAVFCLKKKK